MVMFKAYARRMQRIAEASRRLPNGQLQEKPGKEESGWEVLG